MYVKGRLERSGEMSFWWLAERPWSMVNNRGCVLARGGGGGFSEDMRSNRTGTALSVV
jgi:hypothetical protein